MTQDLRSRVKVDRTVTDTMNRLHVARDLARRLKEEKSTHLWTNEECDLLARLCVVLQVDGAEEKEAGSPSVDEGSSVDSDYLVKRLRARAKEWASLPSAAIDLTDAAGRIETLTAQARQIGIRR